MAGVVPRRYRRDRLLSCHDNIWKRYRIATASANAYIALADGSELRMSITTSVVEIMDEVVGATILMGDEDSEPLLGSCSVGISRN